MCGFPLVPGHPYTAVVSNSSDDLLRSFTGLINTRIIIVMNSNAASTAHQARAASAVFLGGGIMVQRLRVCTANSRVVRGGGAWTSVPVFVKHCLEKSGPY